MTDTILSESCGPLQCSDVKSSSCLHAHGVMLRLLGQNPATRAKYKNTIPAWQKVFIDKYIFLRDHKKQPAKLRRVKKIIFISTSCTLASQYSKGQDEANVMNYLRGLDNGL